MNDYSHILWDWNGTLLDDVWLCVDVVNAMLSQRDRPGIDFKQYKIIFDFPVRNYYERAGFDFSEEEFESVCTEFCEEYERRVCECCLHESAQRILEDCAANGIHQLVLSTTEQSRLETMIAAFGITSLFERVIGQTDHYAAGKAGTAKELLADLGISGDKILMIGDTTHDGQVAKDIRADCVLVSVGHHPHEKLMRTGARVFDHLSQIGTLLGNINGGVIRF